jgi:hypothetical protein
MKHSLTILLQVLYKYYIGSTTQLLTVIIIIVINYYVDNN